MRNGRHVGDAADLQADGVQRAHRGFAARSRALDAHFDILHAALLRRAAAALRRNLRGERRRLARTLACARVGAGALAAYRQALAMAHAAIAAEIHQPLDRHRDLASQVAFDGDLGDLLADLLELVVVQILDLARALDARCANDR